MIRQQKHDITFLKLKKLFTNMSQITIQVIDVEM